MPYTIKHEFDTSLGDGEISDQIVSIMEDSGIKLNPSEQVATNVGTYIHGGIYDCGSIVYNYQRRLIRHDYLKSLKLSTVWAKCTTKLILWTMGSLTLAAIICGSVFGIS